MVLSQGITINTEQIIYICTLVAAVWAVYKIYKEIKKPNDDIKEMVKTHEDKIKLEEERLKEQEEAIVWFFNVCLILLIMKLPETELISSKKEETVFRSS